MVDTSSLDLLKDYAAFLLKEKLHEAALENMRSIRALDLPLLKLFSHLSEEALLALTEQSLESFLRQLQEDTALESMMDAIHQWRNDQLPDIPRDKIEVADLVLSYSIRKQLFVTFLPDYTQDVHRMAAIIHEVEQFYLAIEQHAFQVYTEIQQEVQELANEQLRESGEELQTMNEELQAMIEELRSSNEDLAEQITLREEAEAKLKQLNDVLETRVQARTAELEYQKSWLLHLFAQMPALIGILKGEEGVVELFNEAFIKLWGYREVLGKTMRQAWPELEGQKYFEFVAQVYQTGQPVAVNEYPAMIDRHNDGNLQQAFFNFIYAPYNNPKGETEGVIIYGVDVTEQVLARQKVEQSEENLRIALEAGKMGTWHMDLLKDTTTRSLQHDRIFGYDTLLPAWSYALLLEHVVPEDREMVDQQFRQARESGSLYCEVRIRRPDQEVRWIAVKGEVFYDHHENPSRMAGVVLDITERKQAEEALKLTNVKLKERTEALEKANIDLDNFIYLASHDLKSPIANLEGLINLLNRKLLNAVEGETRQAMEMVNASVMQFKKTLHDLTEITKFQKELKQEAELLSFEAILEEVKQEIQPFLQKTNAVLTAQFEEENICFDRKNLKSIFYNLLTNAIKYRSPDRRCSIHVETTKAKDALLLCVKDNGIGIPQEQQDKVFKMFKRLHRHGEGSGLGLYIVKRIIDNSGGSIEIESEAGKGTTFKLYFR